MTPITPILERLSEEVPHEALFHYTSLTGLKGIVDSKTLYASEARFLNDAAEIKHGARMLGAECVDRLGISIEDRLHVELLNQFGRWMEERISNAWGANVFVTCFTLHSDQLSQWRGYCPKGKGVSIGFPTTPLKAAIKSQGFLLGKCVYDLRIQMAIAKEVVDIIEKFALERGPNMDTTKRASDQSFYDIFDELEEDLLRVCCLFKNSSFSEEAEWRAVSAVVRSPSQEGVSYREGTSMFIPYLGLKLPLAWEKYLMLTDVILGPTPNTALSLVSLANFIGPYVMTSPFKVSASRVPYRDW